MLVKLAKYCPEVSEVRTTLKLYVQIRFLSPTVLQELLYMMALLLQLGPNVVLLKIHTTPGQGSATTSIEKLTVLPFSLTIRTPRSLSPNAPSIVKFNDCTFGKAEKVMISLQPWNCHKNFNSLGSLISSSQARWSSPNSLLTMHW